MLHTHRISARECLELYLASERDVVILNRAFPVVRTLELDERANRNAQHFGKSLKHNLSSHNQDLLIDQIPKFSGDECQTKKRGSELERKRYHGEIFLYSSDARL